MTEPRFPSGSSTGVARFMPIGAVALVGDPEDTLGHLMSAMAAGFEAPMVYVAVMDRNRLVLLAHQGLPEQIAARGELPADGSAMKQALAEENSLFIEDVRKAHGLETCVEHAHLGGVALAIIPLYLPVGEVVGGICLVKTRPYSWTDDERTILSDLAAAATLIVRHRDAIHASGALRAQVGALAVPVRALTEQVRRLSTLVENDEDPRVRTFAALATSRVKQVERILSDTETAARSAGERTTQVTASADISALITRSLRRALGPEAGGAAVRAGVQPVMARADPVELERALTALLFSVRQFAAGTDQIHVRVRESAVSVHVEVMDLGQGIPASEIARLLASFDLDGSPAAASLHLVDGTIFAARGVVAARSSTEGTVFRITLPRARPVTS
jgi:hypothetical protein